MKYYYGTYFNDFDVSLIKPLSCNLTDEDFAKKCFGEGYKEITMFEDDKIVMVLKRDQIKKFLYKVTYTTIEKIKAYGNEKTRSRNKNIYIYADTANEAVNSFIHLTNGRCFYNKKYLAQNIIAEQVKQAEAHTPCLMAII